MQGTKDIGALLKSTGVCSAISEVTLLVWPGHHQQSGHQVHKGGGYADEVDKVHWKWPK
jgi:hypothetical protein